MVPVFIIFHQSVHINFYTLLMIPGLAIIYLNSVIYGIILAMIGSRFRDVSQIIKSLVQVVFFVTPVMWSPSITVTIKTTLYSIKSFLFIFRINSCTVVRHAAYFY